MARAAAAEPRTGRTLGLLLAASGLTSFLALPFEMGSNAGRSVAVLAVAAAWLLAYALGRIPRVGPRPRAVLLAVAAFAAVVVVSSAVSAYREQALTWGGVGYLGAPAWISLAIVFAGASRVRIGARDRAWLALAFAWAPVSALWAIAQVAGGAPASGGFNTSNPLAAMLALSIPVALWGGSVADGRAEKTAWLGSAAVAAAAVALAQAASGWLALALVGAGVLALAPELLGLQRASAALRAARAGLGAVMAAAGALVAYWLAVPEGGFLAGVRAQVVGETFLTRVEMWRMALAVWRDHPIVGAGADSFQLAAQPHITARLLQIEPAIGLNTVPPDPHSFPLLLLAAFGAAGLLAFATAAALGVRDALAERPGESPSARNLRLAALIGVVAWASAGLFIPWAIIMGAAPALLAGLAVSGRRDGAVADARQLAPAAGHIAVRILVAAAAAVLLGMAGMQLAGLARMDSALAADDPGEAARGFHAAAKLQPTYVYPRFVAADLEGRFLGGDSAALVAWRGSIDRDADLRHNAAAMAALARNGLDQAYRFGRTDLEWERRVLEEASVLAPRMPDVLLELAHLAAMERHPERARELLDQTAVFAPYTSRHALYEYYAATSASDDTAGVAQKRAELAAEYEEQLLLDPGLAAR